MIAQVVSEDWPLIIMYEESGDIEIPSVRELAEGLCHIKLSNDWTVSILKSCFGVETWAWMTNDHSVTATDVPIVHGSVDKALAYVDQVKTWP